MKIVDSRFAVIDDLNGLEILKKIERIGRICYKSEDRITEHSAAPFVKMLIQRGHEAMLEHFNFSVLFVVDRGVSHELVRHRIASFAQESTRYCNYGKTGEMTFIRPSAKWAQSEEAFTGPEYNCWLYCLAGSQAAYLTLLAEGCSPQEARAVLPNSLKTEIVISANLREWRHILKLRTAKAAHPDMQFVMLPLLEYLKTKIPVIFEDINTEAVN